MKDVILYNDNIMVKELPRSEEDEINAAGLYIPKQALDDEQVAQGVIARVSIAGYSKGDVVLFHKVMPVDFNVKLEGDTELTRYFFIKESDIICKII